MSHHHGEKYFGGWKLTTIIVVIFLIVLGIIIIPPLVTNATVAKEEVIIGALLPLTGDNSERGLAVQEGIDLAVDELNKSGHNIHIQYSDTESNSTTALENYFSLYDEGVRIFIGPTDSQEAETIAPYAEIYKTPLITLGSSTNLANYTNYIYKFAPSDKYLSSKIATEMTTRDSDNSSNNKVKLAVVWGQNSFARSFYENIEENLHSGHGGESNVEIISVPLTSVESAVNKLAKENPDEILVIPSNSSEFSELLTALYDANICQNCFIAATDTGYGTEVVNNPASYGVSIISSKMFTNPSFMNKFKDVYNKNPDLYASYGYDIINTLSSVIYSNGNDASSVVEGLKNYRGQGVNGQIYFEPETLTRYPVYEIYTSFMGNWYIQDIFNYFHNGSAQELQQARELITSIQKALADGDITKVESETEKLKTIINLDAFEIKEK